LQKSIFLSRLKTECGRKGKNQWPYLADVLSESNLLFYWVKMSNHMNVLDIFYADF